jgi:hypothetical protein
MTPGVSDFFRVPHDEASRRAGCGKIRTSSSMSGDGKRSVAAWPKLPRPSSILPTANCAKDELSSACEHNAEVMCSMWNLHARSNFRPAGAGSSGAQEAQAMTRVSWQHLYGSPRWKRRSKHQRLIRAVMQTVP